MIFVVFSWTLNIVARKLHIGGTTLSPGWEILNIMKAPWVDHVCNANDLSLFESNTFDCIYASHIVEHLDYVDELQETLSEWLRALKSGGKVYISVPDLDVISCLICDKERLDSEERFLAMRMLFGAHTDENDYHLVGLNEEFLEYYLKSAGFADVTKVKEFGIFDDTSSMKFKDVLISLNMTAIKPLGV